MEAQAGNTAKLLQLLGGKAELSGDFLKDLGKKAAMARRLNIDMNVIGGLGSAVGEGTFQAATDSNDFWNLRVQKVNDALPGIELQEKQKLFKLNPNLFTLVTDRETGKSEITPTKQGQQILSQRMAMIKARMMEQVKSDTSKMSALVFMGNIPVLAGTGIITFGKYITSGYRTAKGAASKELARAVADSRGGETEKITNSLAMYAAEHPLKDAVTPLSNDVKKRVTGSALEGTLQYSKRTGLEKLANALKAPVAEGNEELIQQALTFGAGYNYEDTPDDLYHARHSAKYGQTLSNLWRGIGDTYGDYNQWQQFAAAFLSTAVGIPVFGGKSKIGLAGGMYSSYRDQRIEDERNQEKVEFAAKAGANLRDRFNQYIANKVFDEGKNFALSNGDEKKYRDYDDSQMISDAIAVSRTGRTTELYNFIKPYAELTADNKEAIQNIYDATSKVHSIS